MAKNRRQTPPRNQTNTTTNSTNQTTKIQDLEARINALQDKNNELELKVLEYEENWEKKEAELIAKEKELAEKEAQAVNGFKELEAETRQQWFTEKQQEIEIKKQKLSEAIKREKEKILKETEAKKLKAEQEANLIINQAQKEAEQKLKEVELIETNAQTKADQIIEEAQKLANQHRTKVRAQTLKENEETQAQLLDKEKELDRREQSLDAQENNLRQLGKEVARLEADLDEENQYLASQKKKLQEKENQLIIRENACSEETVSRLTAEKSILENQLKVIEQENYRLREQLEQQNNRLKAVSGSPEKLLADNQLLEEKLREYEKKFNQYPSDLELAELERRAEIASDFEAQHRDLQARVDDLERLRRKQQDERLQIEHLRKERDTLKLLNQYLQEQIEDLERMLGELKDKKIQAFNNFANPDSQTQNDSDNIERITVNDLKDLATQTRQWMASLPTREDLETGKAKQTYFAHYYDDHIIQSFIASMAATRLIIIQGVSGTGKTSLPEYFSYAIAGKFARIEVQSSWRDKLDLIGSYNSFFRQFNESAFARAIYEAGTEPYRQYPYFIVLDEMNLSRVEYYFADLLSIMEGRPEDREIELLNHDPTGGNLPQGLKLKNGAVMLPIPDNIWFIGTANTDESTYEITRKVYDRSQILQLDEPFKQENFNIQNAVTLELRTFEKLKQKAIADFAPNKRKNIEECLEKIGKVLHDYFQVGYGQRLLDQLLIFLPIYEATGGKLNVGLDHFIARKLLWQVQHRTDPNVRTGLQNLKETIEECFTRTFKNAPDICRKLLEQELERFKR